MKIGDNIFCLYIFLDVEDMLGKVGIDICYEKLFIDWSDCRLFFVFLVGVLFFCNYIYNQYIFIDDYMENLKQFEKMVCNMYFFFKYSCVNQINKFWIEEYLNEVYLQGFIFV